MTQESANSRASGRSPAGSASVQNSVKQAGDALIKRVPPYNEEAEQSVLAGLFHYENSIDEIFSTVQAEDFYVPRHALLFQACYDLYQARAPIDPQSLAEKLHSQKQLEAAGGMEYISTLYGLEVLGVHALFYARMVRNKSMQRNLINTCAKIMSASYDTPYDMIDGLLDDAEHSIFTIAENTANTNELRGVRDLRESFFSTLEKNAANPSSLTGVPTGFTDLDRLTGGLQASDLIIIAEFPISLKKPILSGFRPLALCLVLPSDFHEYPLWRSLHYMHYLINYPKCLPDLPLYRRRYIKIINHGIFQFADLGTISQCRAVIESITQQLHKIILG